MVNSPAGMKDIIMSSADRCQISLVVGSGGDSGEGTGVSEGGRGEAVREGIFGSIVNVPSGDVVSGGDPHPAIRTRPSVR
jgi:hypothetical protein